MYFELADGPGSEVVYLVATGTVQAVEDVIEIQGHGHIADTLDGGFSDLLTVINDKPIPRRPHGTDKGEQLPLHWQSPSKPKVNNLSASDRLHAHCKCNGVSFWIARPSERSRLGMAAFSDPDVSQRSDIPSQSSSEAWWIRAGGTKYSSGVCACDSCRLACGMEWVEWAFVPTIDITLDAEGQIPFSTEFGTLKAYRSSSKATRHFCGTCGANVFWHGDVRPKVIDVAVGLLDAPEGARAETWLEWRTSCLDFREDAVHRAKSLTLGVEAGLREYEKWVHGSPPDTEKQA